MERVFELGYTNLLSILLSVDDSVFRPFISFLTKSQAL